MVADIHWDELYVSAAPSDGEDYSLRRANLAAVVRETVSAAATSARPQLRGSFSHDDFHLAAAGTMTMSDVDLVVEDMGKGKRDHLTAQIAEAIRAATGLSMPVSAHPRDTFRPLSRPDASFLAIGEFLRHIDECAQDSVRRSFIYAKICLLILRERQQERYVETAMRISTQEAKLAARVKLGIAEDFPLGSAVTLLKTSPSAEANLFAEQCVNRYPDGQFREWYVRSLRARRTIDSWLRNYVANKIMGRRPGAREIG